MTQPSDDRKLYGVMQLQQGTNPNFRGAWRNLGQAHWERDNANQHVRDKDASPFEVYEMTRITEDQMPHAPAVAATERLSGPGEGEPSQTPKPAVGLTGGEQ